MTATVLAEQPVVGAYVNDDATQFTTLTTTAGDPTNMNKIVMTTGRTLLIAQNSDGSNAEWITVYATDDAYGRATNITQQSIPANGWVAFIFEAPGWEQSLGGFDLLVDVESADVKLLAIPL